MPVEVTRRKVPQRTDRRLRSARVKRCGKSAPAPLATGVARQTPPGARSRRERAVRPQTLPGRPHRWMVIHGSACRSRTEPRLQVDSPPPPRISEGTRPPKAPASTPTCTSSALPGWPGYQSGRSRQLLPWGMAYDDLGWTSTKDAADRLGITLRTVYRFIDAGDPRASFVTSRRVS